MLNEWFNTDVLLGGIGYNGHTTGRLVPKPILIQQKFVTLNQKGLGDYTSFVSKFGVSPTLANKFAVSTLNFSNDVKLPQWVKYIVSLKPIETNIPVLTPQQLTIHNTRDNTAAISYSSDIYKSYPSYHVLKQAAYHDVQYEWVKVMTLPSSNSIVRPVRQKPHTMFKRNPHVSNNVVSLSEDFSTVFEDFSPLTYDGFPKSWVSMFLKGQLKATLSPRPGFGMDIVGAVGQLLLNSAINSFLSTYKPTMRKWDTLMQAVNNHIPLYLTKMQIRVVE
jgi:hypothetical protein